MGVMTADRLSFSYGSTQVLHDISFALPDSCRLCALTGPDGAGKSTLLKVLSGMLQPEHGSCSVTAGSCGYMSQHLGLYTELSVWENLRILAALNDVDTDSPKEQAFLQELLRRTDLLRFAGRAAGALSGGMKQKLALAVALSARPSLLVLDEPTVGVDPLSRQELWDIIHTYLTERQACCIFSTAYLEEAQASDFVLFMREGKLLQARRPQDFLQEVRGRTFALQLHIHSTSTAGGDGEGEGAKGTADRNDRENSAADRKLLRQMMLSQELHPEGPVTDVSLRQGLLYLLTSRQASAGNTADLLQELQQWCPALLDYGSVTLQEREPLLEDAYLALVTAQEQGKAQAAASVSAAELTAPPAFEVAEEAVRCEHIMKRFGNFTAVQDSSFAVHRGEIFGLLGPNGAGKTTTFRMLCALLRPTSGQILINGLSLQKQKSAARAQLGYVAQKFALYTKLTLQQNLEYFAASYGLHGKLREQRIQAVMQQYQLQDFAEVKAADLSFGVQRNLAMACALMHRPAILFLDEATSGADPLSRRIFWRRINALAQKGTTVIVTTHFMEEAEYCDRFLIQDHGKILISGTPAEICTDPANGQRLSVAESFIRLVRENRLAEQAAEQGGKT